MTTTGGLYLVRGPVGRRSVDTGGARLKLDRLAAVEGAGGADTDFHQSCNTEEEKVSVKVISIKKQCVCVCV